MIRSLAAAVRLAAVAGILAAPALWLAETLPGWPALGLAGLCAAVLCIPDAEPKQPAGRY